MSLVVAVTTPAGVRLISDTRLTPSERGPGRPRRPHFLDGALKVVVLHPALCMGFAGDAQAGQEAARSLGINPHLDFDLVRVYDILEEHSEADVEFVVASLAGGASLALIRDGQLETGLQRAHIGDRGEDDNDDAFEAYQRHRSKSQLPSNLDDPDLVEASLMFLAMKATIEDTSIATVGELAISVVPERDGFLYAPMGMMSGGPAGGQSIPPQTWTTVEFGGTSDGAFTYSVMVPSEPGIGAIGVHFREGDVGVLYHPTRLKHREVISGVTQEGFCREVRRRHRLTLRGVGFA